MTTFRWKPSLSVGIEGIDEQHKELIRRAAAFVDPGEGRSRQEVGILLSYLRTYALTHFSDEEEAMRDTAYPGYARHKLQHDRFLADLLELSKQQEKRKSPGVPAEELGRWIRTWIVEHVSRTDLEMARWFLHRVRPGAGAGDPPRAPGAEPGAGAPAPGDGGADGPGGGEPPPGKPGA
jgi:hemerythrin